MKTLMQLRHDIEARIENELKELLINKKIDGDKLSNINDNLILGVLFSMMFIVSFFLKEILLIEDNFFPKIPRYIGGFFMFCFFFKAFSSIINHKDNQKEKIEKFFDKDHSNPIQQNEILRKNFLNVLNKNYYGECFDNIERELIKSKKVFLLSKEEKTQLSLILLNEKQKIFLKEYLYNNKEISFFAINEATTILSSEEIRKKEDNKISEKQNKLNNLMVTQNLLFLR